MLIMGLCVHDKTSLPWLTERIVLSAVSVRSFIHCHSEHEHDHDGAGEACSVCMQIAMARHVFNRLVHIALALIALFAVYKKKQAKILPFCFPAPLTLVSIKIRFNT
jgi:hypothetical protein